MPPQTGYSYFLENALKYGWAVPQGVILIWSGLIADIPTGYAFCDGTLSTPDLRDLFVVGARQDSGGVAKTNLTGSLTLGGGQINHQHTFTGDGHQHGPGNLIYLDEGTGDYVWADDPSAIQSAEGYTDDNLQVPVPYWALAYIMKT